MPLFAPALTVEEEDGSPTTAGVKKLQFPNGSVTNDGGGTVSVAAASGSVATDAIYDAKGDLPVGTGANTAAKLTVGANGTVLTAASGEATGTKWETPATGTTPVGAVVLLTSANYTGTASATWGDVTGATHTITTLARRVRVHVAGCAQGATAGDAVAFDIDVDGARASGSTNGLTAMRISNNGYRQNFSFTYLTGVLTAASHTIKLQSNRIVGSGSITVFAVSSDSALHFSVEETLLTS